MRPRPDTPGHRWRSAIYKAPVEGPVLLGRSNLQGDRQADFRVHGGPERAALVYSADHYPRWEAELGRRFAHGSFGENLTVSGLDEESACIGDVLEIGDQVVVQVSEVRGPCYKVQYRTGVPDMIERILANGRGGWYVRVLCEGFIQAGDPVRLAERPNPSWTARRAYLAYLHPHKQPAEAQALRALEGLSSNWAARLDHLSATAHV